MKVSKEDWVSLEDGLTRKEIAEMHEFADKLTENHNKDSLWDKKREFIYKRNLLGCLNIPEEVFKSAKSAQDIKEFLCKKAIEYCIMELVNGSKKVQEAKKEIEKEKKHNNYFEYMEDNLKQLETEVSVAARMLQHMGIRTQIIYNAKYIEKSDQISSVAYDWEIHYMFDWKSKWYIIKFSIAPRENRWDDEKEILEKVGEIADEIIEKKGKK